jgi:hypothetical protein
MSAPPKRKRHVKFKFDRDFEIFSVTFLGFTDETEEKDEVIETNFRAKKKSYTFKMNTVVATNLTLVVLTSSLLIVTAITLIW